MTHQPHELSNLGYALKYFESLPADDISRRFHSGQKYTTSWLNRLKFWWSIDSTLSELNKFYPYQPVVKATYESYQETKKDNQNKALVVSGVSIFAIFQMAKQNFVIPVFSKFGRFLKTHRLFRQYVWLALFPYLFATDYTNCFYLNQTEKLWMIHSERLNQGILSDPDDSQYPIELLPTSQVYNFRTPWVHKYDRPKKVANQVPLMLAPDYENVEQWQKVPIFAPVEDDQDEDEEEEEQ